MTKKYELFVSKKKKECKPLNYGVDEYSQEYLGQIK